MNWLERLKRVPGRVSLDGTVNVDILQWAYAAHLPDNVPHRHAYFEICLVGAWGEGEFVVENRPLALIPGTLFVARPGVIHQIRNTGAVNMELLWVAFQLAVDGPGEIADLFRAFGESSGTLAVADSGPKIAVIWQALRLVAEATPVLGQEAQIVSLIRTLLVAIAQAGAGDPAARYAPESPHSAQSALARIAVQYVHDNLNRPLSVSEIAQHVGLSARHLTRLVVEFTGVPPAAYIEQARMDRARTLLLGSDDPIKQIASLSGYSDVHHFTRVFTRRYGCAPGRFRQSDGHADKTRYGSDIQKSGALV